MTQAKTKVSKMHTIFEVLQGRHPTGELECCCKTYFYWSLSSWLSITEIPCILFFIPSLRYSLLLYSSFNGLQALTSFPGLEKAELLIYKRVLSQGMNPFSLCIIFLLQLNLTLSIFCPTLVTESHTLVCCKLMN